MMEEKRRRRCQGGAVKAEEIYHTLERNTYGGDKPRRRARCELPANPKSEEVKGIKVRFDRPSDKYPGTVEILMTDGEWVKYRIDIEQPTFTAVMESLKEGNWVTGYPPRDAS